MASPDQISKAAKVLSEHVSGITGVRVGIHWDKSSPQERQPYLDTAEQMLIAAGMHKPDKKDKKGFLGFGKK